MAQFYDELPETTLYQYAGLMTLLHPSTTVYSIVGQMLYTNEEGNDNRLHKGIIQEMKGYLSSYDNMSYEEFMINLQKLGIAWFADVINKRMMVATIFIYSLKGTKGKISLTRAATIYDNFNILGSQCTYNCNSKFLPPLTFIRKRLAVRYIFDTMTKMDMPQREWMIPQLVYYGIGHLEMIATCLANFPIVGQRCLFLDLLPTSEVRNFKRGIEYYVQMINMFSFTPNPIVGRNDVKLMLACAQEFLTDGQRDAIKLKYNFGNISTTKSKEIVAQIREANNNLKGLGIFDLAASLGYTHLKLKDVSCSILDDPNASLHINEKIPNISTPVATMASRQEEDATKFNNDHPGLDKNLAYFLQLHSLETLDEVLTNITTGKLDGIPFQVETNGLAQ